MQLIKIMSSRRKRTVAIKKERKRAYIEWLWKENRTSIINTVLMFSRTLLLPNKEICRRDSYKYLQTKTYINNRSIKLIKRPYIK